MWPAARNVSRFHIALYRQLDEVLNRTHPRKSVVFALDGPAPLAKLLTQRCWPYAYGQLHATAVFAVSASCHVLGVLSGRTLSLPAA